MLLILAENTTRLIYHLSIYLLQIYWSHPSHKLPHNVTATLAIQGNRVKSTNNPRGGSTQTSHSVRYLYRMYFIKKCSL